MPDPTPITSNPPPGYFCTHLNAITYCPKNWYCPGGIMPAQRCPDGKWSNAGSMYLQDCGDDMAVQTAIFVSLIILTVGLCCCYLTYWDWANCWGASRAYPEAECVRRGPSVSGGGYGACSYVPAPSAPCYPCYSASPATRIVPVAVLSSGHPVRYAAGAV